MNGLLVATQQTTGSFVIMIQNILTVERIMNKQPIVTVSQITGRKYVKRADVSTQGINTIRDKDNARQAYKMASLGQSTIAYAT